MKPKISGLDHFVLTVADIFETVAFYGDALGMQAEVFRPADGSTRTALVFGEQKINLHLKGAEFEPKADIATAGSADFCMISDTPLNDWIVHLVGMGITIIEGPVARTGAVGKITSIYLRDPDGNLLEIANYN